MGDLYIANGQHSNILQFDGMTGEFACIFAETPPDLNPNTFKALDLLWAPNGNLWVLGLVAANQPEFVAEYDGQTGDFLGYILPPGEDNTFGMTLSIGGPDGDLVIPRFGTPPVQNIHAYDGSTHEYLGIVARPGPPMIGKLKARFASNGNCLVLGNALASPVPTFREYDPSTPLWTLVQNIAIDSNATTEGVIETPDSCCYLVADTVPNHIERFDIAANEFLDVFIPRSPCLDMGPWLPDCEGSNPDFDPCYWDAMDSPFDLAYGPNGHLYISATKTHVPTDDAWQQDGVCQFAMGAVHEFDPVTGEQIQVIGKADVQPGGAEGGVGVDPTTIYLAGTGGGIEFKPLPGDFGSSGAAFQGDWVVDDYDLQGFIEALLGTGQPNMTAANLLSFDFDRDGVVGGKDIPAFVQAYGTSIP